MSNSPANSQGELPLPPGFKTIEQIQNLPSRDIEARKMVNVIGLVKDFREPMPTLGSDWKCTFQITDLSIQYETRGLEVTIFWQKARMPRNPGVAALVLIRNARLQMRGGNVSLIANKTSEFHIVPSAGIPSDFQRGSTLPWKRWPGEHCRPSSPTPAETNYAMQANLQRDAMNLPSDHEYQEKAVQSINKKDKFSLLKDVQPDHWYNILGQVVRVYDNGNHLSMYLSDYTPNKLFHNYPWAEGFGANDGRAGDEFGYTEPAKKSSDGWPGPYGKMTIQLTLFDEHAQFVRENVEAKTWVLLRNVKIQYGKMGGLLEGFLRGDQGRVNVTVMEQTEQQGPRSKDQEKYKDAVKRKLEHSKKEQIQKQKILNGGSVQGEKRKHDGEGPQKKNSKQRREERLAAATAASEAKVIQKLNLNENVRCNSPDQPTLTLKEMLEPRILTKNKDGQPILSPFTVCKYRAHVRVVDYFPHHIEDFAVGRRPTEFDMLSDYSGGEDTDREEDMRIFRSGKGFAKSIWEWRFALQVEDASSKNSKERVWLMVDNHAGQLLLGLDDDATNLRANRTLLGQVKEQLFKLWGDLEEQKSEMLREESKMKEEAPTSSIKSEFPEFPDSSPIQIVGDMPDADSDTENEAQNSKQSKHLNTSALTERDPNTSTSAVGMASNDDKSKIRPAPKNKAFTCCIKQYGVKVAEDDPAKADAGGDWRWQRMFGLFGTQIM